MLSVSMTLVFRVMQLKLDLQEDNINSVTHKKEEIK